MAYMYILRCSDDSYYTGSTKNIEQRLWQHTNGQGAYHTKVRLPVHLMYVEHYERIDEAFAREKQIQKWSRKKKEALIAGDIDALRYLSLSKVRCLSLSKANQ
jgi:putative endonuclease